MNALARLLVATTTLAAAAPLPALAQTLQSLQTPDTPLVLKSKGSFYVGGRSVEQTSAQLGGPAQPDAVTIDQMYVEYMVPITTPKVPLVLIHGASLSGKSYDTTPDGRMGWFEYFVRQSHPTYVVDQVGRARSGFNQAPLVRQPGDPAPPKGFPGALRFGSRHGVWTNFRFGPRYGEAFPDSKFPTEATGELANQAIPELRALLPTPNPNFKALATLGAELKGAVLFSHSQSGHYPMEAALLDPTGIHGMVVVEPGTCGNELFSDAQIARLAKIPTLVMFGDNLASPTGYGTATWQERYDACGIYVKRIRAAGGRADLVQTTNLGVRGNSHMVMQDRNSLQIADYILKWIDMNVPTTTAATAGTEPEAGAGTGRIWRKGSPPITAGPAANFTGTVSVASPYRGTGGSRLGGSTVTFQPGARTAWHRHPLGQTLIVTEGCGWTQREGGPIEKICPGDVAWVAPGEKHWHGATRTTAMTHVTASETVEGREVEWLEKVSDREYALGPESLDAANRPPRLASATRHL